MKTRLGKIPTFSGGFLNPHREPAGFKEISRGVERSATPGRSGPLSDSTLKGVPPAGDWTHERIRSS